MILGRKEAIIRCLPLFSTALINKRDGGLIDKQSKGFFGHFPISSGLVL
ncbi:hypothetical protein FOQG_04239 [Fusarium oxysporum f. sp. raphani 54005]|uniref:Uncharacterized protein n=4 Tax=Fusarium oxysporum TaxID=5507 RepID=X0DHW0_FUSOX|nr:hypothetical protein FOVG_04702 [Fusarium oxysporum f. sp. pisi HDV247]EXK94027.1 hypothetical protein FOQG_04239 [Fusarium oxysporum f. sp. raphani 54005]EXL72317.1 hypothetical protein FOPG_12072 [Fusarium oxysporum f. sp. conglutinans race 2 54008]EXM31582.1 hypothetical protein FOTG_03345 [Fusarium oxysporum f. sp. vasinfectum 25433]